MPTKGNTGSEDRVLSSFSDADFDSWESASDDFGTKIEWGPGVVVTLRFMGTKDIEQEDGSTATAALFESATGEKAFSWMPYSLKQAIEGGKLVPGDIARIEYKGEAPTGRNLNPVKKLDIRVKPRG